MNIHSSHIMLSASSLLVILEPDPRALIKPLRLRRVRRPNRCRFFHRPFSPRNWKLR